MESDGRINSRVQPFTKIEKMKTTSYKPPRAIQARHMTFNIAYGKYIKPLENMLFKKHHQRYHFGKGTTEEVASKILKLSRKYTHYTELDHDSFDAHITKEMLQLTHKYYQSCYYHNKHLRNLSKKTIRNQIRTREGKKFTIKGTRMSGDVDTSFGNSLINYAIIKECLLLMGLNGDVIVNGDDSIIFTNSPINIPDFEEILAKFNMVSKVKPSTTKIHHVEFCRSKLVINNRGEYTMLFDPERLINIFGMTYNCFRTYQQYLKEVLLCNIAMNMSTPLHHVYSDIYTELFGRITPTNILYMLKGGHIQTLDSRLLDMMRQELTPKTIQNESTNEITDSMFQAYPLISDLTKKYKKLKSRIKITLAHPPITNKSIEITQRYIHVKFINHDLKTLTQYDY